MRRIISICMLLGSCLTMLAQTTSLVVDNQTPGWLSSKINYGDQATVRNLKVTGYINATDLKFIGTLIQNRSLDGRLDLSDANVVSETSGEEDNYMGNNCFNVTTSYKDSLRLKFLDLPRTLEKCFEIYGGFFVDTLVFDTKIRSIKIDYFRKKGDNRHFDISKCLVLGENVDSIPAAAFGTQSSPNYAAPNFTDLESVIFSPTIKYIGNGAFTNCQKLKRINLDAFDNLTYLGRYAFLNTNVWLDSIQVPSKLELYNRSSFNAKTNQHIFVRENIKTIYVNSWDSSSYPESFSPSNLKTLSWHMTSKSPPEVSYYSTCYLYGTVYVPKGSKKEYEDYKIKNSYPYCNDYTKVVEVNPVDKIVLNQHILNMNSGDEIILSCVFQPTDADDTTVSWNSKDEDVAEIDQNGKVRAISPGTTWVYATNVPTGVKDSCMVTVIQHVSGISIEPKEVLFSKIGETMQLKAEILPDNATDKSVKWTSSNSSVCAVTESGYLIALNDGTAIIVAMTADGNYPATCVVKVETTTGISDVQSDKGVMKTISGISVNGKVGEPICVINSQGVVVYRGVCNGGEEQVTLPKGLYIVTIGDKTMKIVL